MAERIAYLEAVVGADITQFRKGMRDIRNETGLLSESLQGIAGIGRSLTFTLTTPLVTLGTYFAEAANTFDSNMRNINSLLKMNQKDFQALSTEVLNYGMSTRAGANASAEALYSIFSAGYGLDDTSKAMAVLEQATLLSEAGLSDLTKTTETLTATMALYGKFGIDAAHASDVWANMVAFGVGSLEDFQRLSGKVLPSSAALNVSLDNMGATAAFLSQGYSDANKAMTALSMLQSNMLKPNKTLMEAYIALGVTTGQELVAKFGSLEEAVIAVKEVTNDVDFAKSFSKTGMEAALMLTNDIDATRQAFVNFYDTIEGQALGEWQQQIQSFSYQFDRFKSALEGVAIALGSQILPLVAPFIGWLTDGLIWFAQLNPEIHRFTVLMGGVAAAVGPVLWIFGSLIGTLTPMGLLFKGIIAAVSAFSTNFMGLRDTIEQATSGITGNLQPLADTINNFYEALFPDSIKGKAETFAQDATNPLTGNWQHVVDTSKVITVEGPTSLYDIFIEQGYDDLFSWHEFMKLAEEGGWEKGTAVDVGDMITIEGVDGVAKSIQKTKSQMDLMMNGGLVDPSGTATPSTFLDRFKKAVTDALPGVLTELGNVLNTIKNWADYHIGTGLSLLATLFSGSSDSNGKTPIYEAVRMALDGDIIGAIDAVIPGAGDHLRNLLGTNFGTKLQEAFPEISLGITNLLTEVGEWLKNEGVPTLSRSVGYVVGRVGVAFGSLLGNLWGGITSGGAANGAGNLASGIADTVIDPAMQGFNDAMKDTGVTNFVDQLFSLLGGALVTAAGAWTIGVGFKDGVFAAIKFALSGLLSFSIWAGGWALKVMGKLGAALVAKAGIDTAWGSAQTAIKDGLKMVVTGATNAITSATSWVLSSALSVVKALGAAIATSPISAGIAIGTIIYMAIPESVKQQMRDGFKVIVDSIFGEGTTSYLNDAVHDAVILGISTAMYAAGDTEGAKAMASNLSGGTNLVAPVAVEVEPEFWADGFDLSTDAGKDAFMGAYFPDVLDVGEINTSFEGKVSFDEIKAGIDEQYQEYFSPDAIANALAQGITWDEYTKQIDEIARRAYDIVDEELLAEGAEWTMPNILPTVDLEGVDIPVNDVRIDLSGANVSLADPAMALLPENFSSGEDIVTYITPDGQVIEEKLTDANTKLSDGVTALGMTIASNIGDGTNLDAEKVYTDFLQPLENHFVTVFGVDGTITKTMTTFSGTLADKFAGIGTQLATASTNTATELAKVTLAFSDEFSKIGTIIQNGIDKIKDWNNAVTGMEGAGGSTNIPVDGSHASGLTNVPFDGYIAKLHKGERVLTKEEAKDYGTIPRGALLTAGASGPVSNSNQTVNFFEAPSVDRIVRELIRRGYKLDKR